jgi:hypothetical protein
VPRLNRYYRRSRIAEWKFRSLLRYFALDLTASDAAQLTSLSERAVIVIFGKIRRRIAEECERQSPFNNGEVEVDESRLSARTVSVASAVVEQVVRLSSSVFSSVMILSIKKSSRTARRLLYRPLFVAESQPML